MDDNKINENLELNIENSTDVIEDGEIQEILELEGIEVWGQHQTVLEQQALLHLQSLQQDQDQLSSKNEIEDGEIITENKDSEIKNKLKPEHATLDINKFIERQIQLKNNQISRRKIIASENGISDKSLEAAKKISNNVLQRSNKKIDDKQKKKTRKDSEKSNISEENCTDAVNDEQINESGSEYYPSDDCHSDDEYKPTSSSSTSSTSSKRKRTTLTTANNEIKEKIKDDGLLSNYKKRQQNCDFIKELNVNESTRIEGKLKIPTVIWNKLYSYQQEGVKWLWNMHKQTAGGLLGDEMGLGKTVQIIVFLAALEYSKITSYNGRYHGLGASIIVCPATVIHQWVQHFHNWWPPFRVALLHQSGSYNGNKTQLITEINKNNGILITTYESILKYKGVLIDKKWHYLILDEGHKIRNPNAKITIAVKHLKTPHKLILTGSPMQNNLQELWSLFDFIVPGKLGTQQAFTDYFATPITVGGYTNATPTQETTALLIATTLKDMISPYMLRRTKDEVRDCIYLPNKSEQVLFCSLTDEQRDLYRGFLLSDHVGGILGRVKTHNSFQYNMRANILVGITTLRKICNHPDLYLGELTDSNDTSTEVEDEKSYGYYKRSGKMVVVGALLKIWKRQGHRVLLFTQSRAMVEIFQDFLRQQNYTYLKMDGSTSVSNRQPLIDKFNQDTSYDVFLLTTRVGGLGVNLIGANRVIIYDPDWNPATDTQARERAWRIGQQRQVTVYRLVSAGTIEEKMYQRQVWKQLLSNKILIDPKTKRFFKSSDLTELFSLQEHTDKNPETANIFRNSKIDININKNKKSPKIDEDSENTNAITFSEDKIQAMKSLAAQIAKNMSQQKQAKEELKKKETEKEQRPSPSELLAINRMKLVTKPEPIANKIDDQITNDSFADALTIAEKTSCEYKKTKRNLEEIESEKEEPVSKKFKTKNKKEVKVDVSGEIDGEKVEGLVKREVKKKEKSDNKTVDQNQDNYVLEKLFSKKGVHTALQHDVIVQSDYKDRNNLKIHYEAQLKADMALKALRKSRLNNWSW